MSMRNWLRLENKTWPQLREAAWVAIGVLKNTDSSEAREALQKIEHILSPDWPGAGQGSAYAPPLRSCCYTEPDDDHRQGCPQGGAPITERN